jgi:hypothetical protein
MEPRFYICQVAAGGRRVGKEEGTFPTKLKYTFFSSNFYLLKQASLVKKIPNTKTFQIFLLCH